MFNFISFIAFFNGSLLQFRVTQLLELYQGAFIHLTLPLMDIHHPFSYYPFSVPPFNHCPIFHTHGKRVIDSNIELLYFWNLETDVTQYETLTSSQSLRFPTYPHEFTPYVYTSPIMSPTSFLIPTVFYHDYSFQIIHTTNYPFASSPELNSFEIPNNP